MNLFSRLPSTWLEIEGAFVAFPLPPSLHSPFLLLVCKLFNCSGRGVPDKLITRRCQTPPLPLPRSL